MDEQTIHLNDDLRKHFRGGRIEVCHGPYEIDDRTMGRMLCALATYNKFEPGSLHDEGAMVFAGFQLAWRIETVENERVMRVWVNADVLQNA